jgi:RNA polymerase sigma factor (sigma-70 family)
MAAVCHPSLRSTTERNSLVENNLHLVAHARRVYFSDARGADAEDLDGVGYIALLRAAELYNPQTAAFSTYAVNSIWRQMLMERRRQVCGLIRIPDYITGQERADLIELLRPCGEPTGSLADLSHRPASISDHDELRAALADAVAQLSGRAQAVARLRLQNGASNGEIAAALGVTRQAVSLTMKRLRRKLSAALVRFAPSAEAV